MQFTLEKIRPAERINDVFIAPIVGVPIALVVAVVLGLNAPRAGEQNFVVAAIVLLLAAAGVVAAFYFDSLEHRVFVVVGIDGVAFHEGFHPPKFISYDRIAGARVADSAFVEIDQVRGGILSYFVPSKKNTRDRNESAKEVVLAIEGAREVYRAAAASVHDEPVLAREGRAPHAWLEALRAIGAGEGGDFRHAPVARDQLWRVVESSASPSAQRLAASVALRCGANDGDLARLRVVADRSADALFASKFRVVTDSTTDEELEKILEEETAAPIELSRKFRRLLR